MDCRSNRKIGWKFLKEMIGADGITAAFVGYKDQPFTAHCILPGKKLFYKEIYL